MTDSCIHAARVKLLAFNVIGARSSSRRQCAEATPALTPTETFVVDPVSLDLQICFFR